jgi:hypothetical protein
VMKIILDRHGLLSFWIGYARNVGAGDGELTRRTACGLSRLLTPPPQRGRGAPSRRSRATRQPGQGNAVERMGAE